MENVRLRYSTSGKALPPRPIKLQVPGWGGSPEFKMVNGSAPQPWHCPPFVEGSTYGLELVYHYENEAHIYHEGDDLKIDWDYASEPGGTLGSDEFGLFAPKPAKYYFYASLIDIRVPPGYVIRTQPHPRFFTDHTGTVPAAIVGHVQTEWWPKKLFVVFKAPKPGERHVFRKGEPYVQLLVVPQKANYDLERMSADEDGHRRTLEQKISMSKSFIARDVWQDSQGSEFNDHYRTLARAFVRDGEAAVEQTIEQGVREFIVAAPPGLSVAQYLELAYRFQQEGKLLEAREALFYARRLDPANPEVVSRLGIVAGAMGLPDLAVKMMTTAAAMRPDNAAYHNNLGVSLRRLGRHAEAENAFRNAVRIKGDDPMLLSNLGLCLADQGRAAEGLELCRTALALNANLAPVQFRTGLLLARLGRADEARACFEETLRLEPQFAQARRALEEMSSAQPANG